MSIITLTTDLGTTDFYLAAVKGSILSAMPDATIVDISHHIPPYQIIQAAFLLSNAYYHFPLETVHLVSIDNSYQSDAKFVALKAKGHYFIGPDNGLFSLFLNPEDIEKIVKINLRIQDDFIHFPIKDILAKSAVHLAKGGKMEIIGRKITNLNYKTIIQPVIEPRLFEAVLFMLIILEMRFQILPKKFLIRLLEIDLLKLYLKETRKLLKFASIIAKLQKGKNFVYLALPENSK